VTELLIRTIHHVNNLIAENRKIVILDSNGSHSNAPVSHGKNILAVFTHTHK
jgi:hypothetical protein